MQKFKDYINEGKYIPIENLVNRMAKFEVSKKERFGNRILFVYADDLEESKETNTLVISGTLKIIYQIKESSVNYNYTLE